MEKLGKHQKVIKELLAKGSQFLEILDTCRIDNDGILTIPDDLNMDSEVGGDLAIGGFVPSAGAASRFFKLLVEILAQENPQTVAQSLNEMQTKQLRNCPLDERLLPLIKEFVKAPEQSLLIQLRDLVHEIASTPKALQPAFLGGESFLLAKMFEHMRLGCVQADIYIVQPEFDEDFSAALSSCSKILSQRTSLESSALPTRLLYQGADLATFRFYADGEPVLEDGNPVLVPAGHGELAQLFDQAKALGKEKDDFPELDAVFIRNVDSLLACSATAYSSTKRMLSLFRQTLWNLRCVRAGLMDGNNELAVQHGKCIIDLFNVSTDQNVLEFLAYEFFLAPRDLSLIDALHRPLNFLGQVPNTSSDIGGAPCYVNYRGHRARVCVEGPHFSPEDKQKWLSDPNIATHFNPVFVVAELPEQSGYYASSNEDLRFLAKKTYQGSPVVYFESALYEILGNSVLCNSLFLEVPRQVFNPTKSISDGCGRLAEEWFGPEFD